MRGSAGAPAIAASRSDSSPAQNTASRARVSPPGWRRATRLPPAVTPDTGAFVTTSTPRSRSSPASVHATAPKSTIPVEGECNPATPRQWGSSSAISAASRRRRPVTPLARPRRSSLSSGGTSAALRATITLPQRSCGTPSRSQNSYISRAPSTQRRAFSDPGS